ncbi:MAG: 4-hydroxythreonine-4-phosphate dehydrogenase PdxA [Arenimonas sp.]
MIPRLALIAGEPAGIGPECCVRIAQSEHFAHLIAIADPSTLYQAAEALKLPLHLISSDQKAKAGELAILPMTQKAVTTFGKANPENAHFVIASLLRAAQGCIDGEFDGMVTGPVNKASINAGGIAYTGTTELLAEHAGCDVVMMLANPHMRVALATTHLSLREVPDAITQATLKKVLTILHRSLQKQFAIDNPHIAVLGLNPHAGEAGVLGREEIEIIEPCLKQLREQGMLLSGPLPADTAFLPQKLNQFDAVLAMYHDQGLPVLKHSGFEDAVNITLGLPYPRVAVDHGTALEIAGMGIADASSLLAAVTQCTQLASARNAV